MKNEALTQKTVDRARAICEILIEKSFDAGNIDEFSIRQHIAENYKDELIDFMRDIEDVPWEKVITQEMTFEQVRLADSGLRGVSNIFSTIADSILVSFFMTDIVDLTQEIKCWIEEYYRELNDGIPFQFDKHLELG